MRKLLKVTVFFIAFQVCAVATVAADEWKVIHAGQLLAVPGEGTLSGQSIVVRNNRIERVESGYVIPEVPEGDSIETIDLKHAFVLPGLLDMHVHLDLNGSDWAESDNPDADAAYDVLRAVENARKTLEAGFTTVRNPGGRGWAVFAVRDAIDKGGLPGPRILAAGHTITASADEDYSGACSGVEGCRAAVRRQIEMGADMIKIYATCSGSQPCGHGNARPVFLDDEMRAVIETAKTRQLTVAAHAHAIEGIKQALRLGVNSIEHSTFADQEAIDLYLQNNVYMVPTIAVQDNVIRDYAKTKNPAMRYVMENAMASHPMAVRRAYEAGVTIAAGSDAGVIPHGENANELFWYVNNIGMSPEEAIVAATINGAALIRRSDDLGTIQAGKLADVIATADSPLENIEALRSVVFVMKDGKVYNDTVKQ